ncbi:Ankyrin-1 [Halotydeus destructor]|nr:Ankyrin-1 [Halotydeus destructor]
MVRATPVHDAILNNNIPDLKYLLCTGVNDINSTDKEGLTALHYAARDGNLEAVSILLEQPKLRIDCLSGESETIDLSDKRTPLHLAADYGHHEVVEILLKHGANVDALDRSDKTPLFLATSNCNFRAAMVLLSHGADVNAETIHGQSVLQLSLTTKQYGLAKLLLSKGAKVKSRFLTPMIRTRSHKITNLLLDFMDAGDPELNGICGTSNCIPPVMALIYVLETNEPNQISQTLKILRKFLLKGANLNCKSKSYPSIFHAFIKHRYDCDQDPGVQELFRTILSHPGIDIDLEECDIDNSPLSMCVATNNFILSELLILNCADVQRCSLSELMYSFRAERFLKLLYWSGYSFPPLFRELHKPGPDTLMRPGDTLELHSRSFTEFISWLDERSKTIMSLKQLARVSIRKSYGRSLPSLVKDFSIPDILKSYLMFLNWKSI